MTSRIWIEEQMRAGWRVVELGTSFYVFKNERNLSGPFGDRGAAEAVLAKLEAAS